MADAKVRPGDALRSQVVLRGGQVERDRWSYSVLDRHKSRPCARKFHLACQEPRANDDGVLGADRTEGNPGSEAFGQLVEALDWDSHGLLAWAHASFS